MDGPTRAGSVRTITIGDLVFTHPVISCFKVFLGAYKVLQARQVIVSDFKSVNLGCFCVLQNAPTLPDFPSGEVYQLQFTTIFQDPPYGALLAPKIPNSRQI